MAGSGSGSDPVPDSHLRWKTRGDSDSPPAADTARRCQDRRTGPATARAPARLRAPAHGREAHALRTPRNDHPPRAGQLDVPPARGGSGRAREPEWPFDAGRLAAIGR